MTPKTYVFGHQNPDTDSICSAIAYAHLKQALGHTQVSPARLGAINTETQFALDTFQVDAPPLINDVKPHVSDIVFKDFSVAFETDSISKTMLQITKRHGRSLPVIDQDHKLVGTVALSDIIPAYTDPFSKSILRDNETPLQNIVELLNAKVHGTIYSTLVKGDLFTITEIVEGQTLKQNDMLITVLQESYLTQAFSTGAGIIIVSNVSPDADVPIPDDFNGVVLNVAFSPFEVIRLLCQGIPIKNYYQKDRIEYFIIYETLEDVKENMLTSEHERFPVVDNHNKVLSSISRGDLLNFNRKKVILVDHNERKQSVEGVADSEIIEVIDHHRVAEIQTANPLYLRIEPVGCTATIVTKMYKENEIDIPTKIAGLLLSAIISDTLLFNSPTCTPEDQLIAEELGQLLDIDIKDYGQKMLVAGSNMDAMDPSEILSMDRKISTMGPYKIAISQINTCDSKSVLSRLEAVLDTMNQTCSEENLDLAVLIVTDIVLGGSEIIATGEAQRLVQLAFGFEPDETHKYLDGVYSRKKQIVPPLMNASSY